MDDFPSEIIVNKPEIMNFIFHNLQTKSDINFLFLQNLFKKLEKNLN